MSEHELPTDDLRQTAENPQPTAPTGTVHTEIEDAATTTAEQAAAPAQPTAESAAPAPENAEQTDENAEILQKTRNKRPKAPCILKTSPSAKMCSTHFGTCVSKSAPPVQARCIPAPPRGQGPHRHCTNRHRQDGGLSPPDAFRLARTTAPAGRRKLPHHVADT